VIETLKRHADVVELCGVEGYEGTINLSDPAETIRSVDRFLDFAIGTLTQCKDAGVLRSGEIL